MIYLNNKLVPRDRALISVYDHGFLYGDGIYETLRAYKGIVYMIDEHVSRLFRSALLISLEVPLAADEVKEAVYQTLKANRLSEAVIRITISRGPGPVGLDPALCLAPTFVIFAGEFKPYPPRLYKRGVKVAVVPTRRNYKKALDPQIKSLNFLNNVLAKIEAKERGAYEAIMLNYRGYIAEGTVSNVFFIRDKVLCTPSLNTGILDGITRRTILGLAEELNIETEEGNFRPGDMHASQEVFISNTTMELMPVSQADDSTIGPPGTITKNLHRAYRKKVGDYIRENII